MVESDQKKKKRPETDRVPGEGMEEGEKGLLLQRKVRGDLTQEMTPQEKMEGLERSRPVTNGRTGISERRSLCKGPEVRRDPASSERR